MLIGIPGGGNPFVPGQCVLLPHRRFMQQVNQPRSSGAMATSATGLRPSNGTVTSSETRSLKFAGMQWLAGGNLFANSVKGHHIDPWDLLKHV